MAKNRAGSKEEGADKPMSEQTQTSNERLPIIPTGVEGLDTILGGGIPRGALVMVVGEPGSGKTVLMQQVCFHWAKRNHSEGRKRKAIYFSTVTEPHDKLIAHTRQFGFYEDGLVPDDLEMLSLQEAMLVSIDAVVETIISTARVRRAGLVVIDGFRSLFSVAGSSQIASLALFRLSSQLNILGCTGFVTYEASIDVNQSGEMLTTTDVVIAVGAERHGSQLTRRIDIRKVRGQAQLTGLHSYEIGKDGWEVYPRLETIVNSRPANDQPFDPSIRLKLDGGEIDRLMEGGIPKGSITMVAGAPGTGKTLLNLHFLAQGIANNEPCLLLNFDETEQQLLAKADRFNLPLRQAVASGLLRLHALPPVDLEPNKLATMIRREVEQHGIRRMVIDSFDPIEQTAGREGRGYYYVAALVAYLRSKGVSLTVSKDLARVTGLELDLGTTVLGLLSENLILLRYIEREGRFYRVLNVLKMRDSDYENGVRHFIIDREGITVQPLSQSIIEDSSTRVMAQPA